MSNYKWMQHKLPQAVSLRGNHRSFPHVSPRKQHLNNHVVVFSLLTETQRQKCSQISHKHIRDSDKSFFSSGKTEILAGFLKKTKSKVFLWSVVYFFTLISPFYVWSNIASFNLKSILLQLSALDPSHILTSADVSFLPIPASIRRIHISLPTGMWGKSQTTIIAARKLTILPQKR